MRGKLLGKGGFAKCYEITNLETKKILHSYSCYLPNLIKTIEKFATKEKSHF